ncbi:LysR substrate-binding domain-containing protein [Bradyrhizobium cenepequi]|uniref:LysR substrate-binding domain-containing protein n=1 Tax=Bradyrhizobium cenepequi TaxID=2821403 RepID=UPI001CE2AA5F|nr:LysR substrate-binding domain-containing protein [Bradyrhizobium cenepequi]
MQPLRWRGNFGRVAHRARFDQPERTLHGVGVAVLPSWAVSKPLRIGALRRVLAAWGPPASTIYAVHPDNWLMSMKVRAFVDHLAR